VKALDFALRHPITVMVVMVGIALGSVFAVRRMRTDVFPDLNMPIIYVAQAYGGMDPAQMEGFIANYYEYAFLYMNGIDHVETRNIQNLCLVKLFFHPGTDMAQAMAESAIYANRAKAYFPPGTVNPFILRLDASSVPVAYLVTSSETRSINELSDLMLFRIRPILASLPGTSAPQPFGGSLRSIVVSLDPDRLRAYNLSPQEVSDALNKGNTVTPSGNARIGDQMQIVSINSIVADPKDLGNIPIKPEENVYLRDLGTVEDSMDIPTGWALVNGRRSVYMPIVKTAEASTVTVVSQLKDNLDQMRAVLPPDVGGGDHGAGGGGGRGGRIAPHQHHPEYPVVHGRDHGDRRGGRQRDPSRDLRRKGPAGRADGRGSGGNRGRGPIAADPHDQLRDGRRHGSDGAGVGRGWRTVRAARTGGDRRPDLRDLGDVVGVAGRVRGRARPKPDGVGVAPARRPRKPAPQPGDAARDPAPRRDPVARAGGRSSSPGARG
jgi:hypothetical protein